MLNWVGIDLRGFTIVFPQSTFDHAIARGHLTKAKGLHPRVMEAFATASIVIDNPPLEGSREDGSARHGHERYVSAFDPGTYLIIPVKVTGEPFVQLSATALIPPVRIALSAYTSETVPTGKVLWQCPTPKPEE